MTLVLTRGDVASLMGPRDYLTAIEQAFAASKRGLATAPAPLHLDGDGGAFHAKGATIIGRHTYAAIKINANFPGNPARGRPTIQGVVALFNGEDGALLALMDSIEITVRRTAAATALAARCLARCEAVSVTICGCGRQGLAQLEALAQVATIVQAYVFDIDADKATALATSAVALGFPVEPAHNLRDATQESDIVVTCTTARTPFLDVDHVRPGTFIAAIGADNPEKSEIKPELMARAKVVVDALDQCARMGDLHHAIKAGTMTREDVYASLADIAAGEIPKRPAPCDLIVFDLTGTALQDVSSAAVAYERALAKGLGEVIDLNENAAASRVRGP